MDMANKAVVLYLKLVGIRHLFRLPGSLASGSDGFGASRDFFGALLAAPSV